MNKVVHAIQQRDTYLGHIQIRNTLTIELLVLTKDASLFYYINNSWFNISTTSAKKLCFDNDLHEEWETLECMAIDAVEHMSALAC